jgi:hypothetical protein
VTPNSKEKKRLYDIEYRKKNQAKIQERNSKYHATHKNEKAEYDKKYREKNTLRIAKRRAEWYKKNREDILKKAKLFYVEKSEKIKQYASEHKKKHRKEANARNYARNHITLEGKQCELCQSTRALQRHHPDYSKPLEIQVLCSSCHRRIHEDSVLLWDHSHDEEGNPT